MFPSRKKPEPPKKRNHDLSQFGLMDIPDDFDPSVGHDDADSDLEAELAAIAGGGASARKPKPKASLIPTSDLDKMIADSLRDVDDNDDDGDLENDEDLVGELKNIAGSGDEMELEAEPEKPTAEETEKGTATVTESSEPQLFLPTTTVDIISVINQRIQMYKQAEANAKAAGEAGKARRFTRGLKTLGDQLKQASTGKSINVDDIPPEVSVKAVAPETPTSDGSGAATTPSSSETTPSAPIRPAPSPPQKTTPETESPNATENTSPAKTSGEKPTESLIEDMRTRQRDYKAAALQSKRSGETSMALQYLKVVKQFDIVIKMVEDGQEVDLSDMPPSPEKFKEFLAQMQAAATENAPEAPEPPPAAPEQVTPAAEPTSMLEALQQRLNKYKSVEDGAKAEGNTSKARRFGRIVKQYEDAIKLYKNGSPVPYDELPVPPGFGPLPTEAAAAGQQTPKQPTSAQSPTTPTGSASSSGTTTPNGTPTQRRTTPKHHDLTTRTSGNQQKNNLAENQMKILLDRQKEFKVAAIEAKKAGEIEQAKEYLKIYKGFDALLNAASSGLPVDLSTLPLPPSQRENLEESFAIIGTEEPDSDDDISDIGVRIEEQLAKQLMMCKNTRDHHKAMGDIAGMNRFENLAVTVQKDLDLVRYSKRKNYPLPKFHYEKRSFNIVHCNTDLTDSELEIIVIRGMSYKCANPKEIDTYVRIEFPLLNEETFKAKTSLVKDTDSPEYDQHFKVEIQRGNRQFQRIFKRHGVKFEVFSRGGFLRSDILLGTVNVKLQPLETKCDIHDTFDLMEGRKQVGGKLEVKLSVRNPILTKQIEHLNEKWLVLDS